MAVLFGLVVNFGTNLSAVERARAVVAGQGVLRLRGFEVSLGEPYVSGFDERGRHVFSHCRDAVEYVEFSVYPRGIGYGGPGPRLPFDVRTLTDEELIEVGRQLYDLLRGFDGYQAAMVGWNPEPLVEVGDLRNEWGEEIASGELDGLVVSDELRTLLAPSDHFESFRPGYAWIPYRGTKNWH